MEERERLKIVIVVTVVVSKYMGRGNFSGGGIREGDLSVVAI